MPGHLEKGLDGFLVSEKPTQLTLYEKRVAYGCKVLQTIEN